MKTINEQNKPNAVSASANGFGKTGRVGSYTVIMAVILLAALIVINLLISSLPSKYTMLDTSSTKMYTLSETTEKFVSELDEKITIYFLCTGGKEDDSLRAFLDRFAALSGNVTVKVADPVAQPTFLEKYTKAELSNYSVIVESGKRFKVIDYVELYYVYNEYFGKLTLEEYNMYSSYSQYQQYFVNYPTAQYFDGDNMLTGAIEYVTADTVPTMYILEGHSESALPDIAYTYFDYFGLTYTSLNIALDGDAIPDDCSCLVINAPQSDLTAAEAAKIMAYIDGGGCLMLMTGAGVNVYENLMSVTAAYGMSAAPGIVYEGTSGKYYPGTPQYIYPSADQTHAATAGCAQSGYKLLVPSAHGITLSEVKDITVTPLFTTSAKAYAVSAEGNSAEQSFNLAAAAEKVLDAATGKSAKIIWIGTTSMISETFVNATNGGNFYYFYSMLNWMNGGFTSTLADISAVEMSDPTLVVTEAAANFWGSVFIFIVPGAVALGGLFYWLHRRRR